MNSSKNFFLRLLEGTLLIALFVAAVSFAYTFPWGFCLFSFLVIALATGASWELCALLKKKQRTPFTYLLLIGGGLYLFLHTLAYVFPSLVALPLLWLLVLLAACAWYILKRKEEVFSALASTIFGFVYIYLPTQLLLDITYSAPSPSLSPTRWWLVWTLLIIKGSDIAAYFAGKSIGKRPLTAISPKKTWEGFHAGWIGGALCSLLMSHAPGAPSLSWFSFVFLGASLAVCSTVGDLIESRLKREVGVKDSNSALPGLGGFLDMADSLLFATPFAYFCFRYFGA